MNLILKKSPQTMFSQLYVVENNQVDPIALFKNENLQDLIESGMFTEIQHTEIIEKYYFSSTILKNVKHSKYYNLNTIQ